MPVTERRSCRDKVAYWTRREAEGVIGYLVREKGMLPGRMEAYRCPYCGWFHIGHKRSRRRGKKVSWATA